MNNKVLQDKFFSDPDWKGVEELLMTKINVLKDFNTIDATQSAETVKAEVIGRRLAYTALLDFLQDCEFIRRKVTTNPNPFK